MHPSDIVNNVSREPMFIAMPLLKPRMTWQTVVGMLAAYAVSITVLYLLNLPMLVLVVIGGVMVITVCVMAIMVPLHDRNSVHQFRGTSGQSPNVQVTDHGTMREYRTVPSERTLPISDDEGHTQKLITELAEQRGVLGGRNHGFWTWQEFEANRIKHDLPRMCTIAAEQVKDELLAIPRETELLEPEFVLSSAPQSTKTSFIMPVFLLFGAMVQLTDRKWVSAGFMGTIALVLIAHLPAVRNRIPGLRYENRAPVAGVGTIEDYKRRKWNVNEATMLISSKAAHQPLFVYVVGPAGWLTFTFASSSDPDFINLWQRWTHPHPRPEL